MLLMKANIYKKTENKHTIERLKGEGFVEVVKVVEELKAKKVTV